ncbi:MAG: hypothetical protein P1U67_09460 [Alcanivoracaceae bacterium]|nr:hypothetical protein [Alcanivoracaceae bacterium]
MWLLCLFGWLICVWAAFFGGAEKLEGSFLGYFEFGEFAEKASFIRAAAFIGLAIFAAGIIYDLAV